MGTTIRSNGRVIIVGDLNGRVGRRDEESGETIGNQGETTRNNNGKRLIEYCMMNNLIITNTFFAHKDIHNYTREVVSRKERSIIDYVMINNEFRRNIKDTRVRRGCEISSDHYLVLSKVEISKQEIERTANTKVHKEEGKKVIRTYKLREEETAIIYNEKIEREMRKIKREVNNMQLENMWEKIGGKVIRIKKRTIDTKNRE